MEKNSFYFQAWTPLEPDELEVVLKERRQSIKKMRFTKDRYAFKHPEYAEQINTEYVKRTGQITGESRIDRIKRIESDYIQETKSLSK